MKYVKLIQRTPRILDPSRRVMMGLTELKQLKKSNIQKLHHISVPIEQARTTTTTPEQKEGKYVAAATNLIIFYI